MRSYDTYDQVIEAVESSGKPFQILGYAPGGNPIVAVEAGGQKDPPIFVTAGAHATEHAGVCAAVELIEEIDTEHRTYIIPSRDPVGLNGYNYALNLSLNENVELSSYDEVESLLRSRGEVLYEEDGFILSLIGDYGYATQRPSGKAGAANLMKLKDFTETHPDVLHKIRGRRIFTTPSLKNVDGSDGLNRAYTVIIDPDGMPMHLNRFFTTDWAPVESRCVKQIMDEVQPGLTFDNHETTGHDDRFHISLRPQRTEERDHQEKTIAKEMISKVADAGVTLATDDDVLGEPTRTVAHNSEDRPDESFYSRACDGGYWVDPNLTSPPRLGEGLNATDYAAEKYGLAYTLECGMYGSLDLRIDAALTSIQTGVQIFENNHK